MTEIWVDNHCHLDPASAGDAIAEAARGVVALVDVGTDAARSAQAVQTAAVHDCVGHRRCASHDATEGVDGILPAASPEVVAVGEAGLDYHTTIPAAGATRRVRRADPARPSARSAARRPHAGVDDTFTILDREGVPARTVFHCFTGGPAEALAGVERGAWVSISGIVTFKTADDVRAAVAAVPLDRLMVETDSPYLAPVPHRGRPNRPALVPLVGATVAAVKGVDVTIVAAQTTANAMSFYGLSAP
jgi:TatD DNase family protein